MLLHTLSGWHTVRFGLCLGLWEPVNRFEAAYKAEFDALELVRKAQ